MSNPFAESPLHYCKGKASGDGNGKAGGAARPGVLIRESAFRGHLNLRGDPNDEGFTAGVAEVLGLALPTQPGTYAASDQTSLYWLGPDEWLAIVANGCEAEVERRLREVLRGHFSIVDLSGGQTLINISGSGVEALLKKSSSYDFHPARFGIGRCVQTSFAKTVALVSKKADGSFDLVVRRSFADYLAAWLLDAGAEFGCRIQSG